MKPCSLFLGKLYRFCIHSCPLHLSTPTSVTLPLAFQASNEVTQYEVNTVEHSQSFSFVGLGGGEGNYKIF
jgi:hypothetical protein